MRTGWRLAVLALALLAGAAACREAGTRPLEDQAGTDDAVRRRDFWVTYRRAAEARSAGRLDDAVRLYRRALTLQADHEDSLYYLGNCLLERREYADALAAYQRLVTVNPSGSSRAYMQIASIRGSLDPAAPGNLAEADAAYRQALAVDPDSGALLGLAEVALLDRRDKDAERLLLRVDADNPMSIAAPYLRGYLAFTRGAHDEAWRLFATAVSRGELKKGALVWTEEGDVKGTPELRWRALARQSLFGPHWIRLRAYVPAPGPTPAAMRREYANLQGVLSQRRHGRPDR